MGHPNGLLRRELDLLDACTIGSGVCAAVRGADGGPEQIKNGEQTEDAKRKAALQRRR